MLFHIKCVFCVSTRLYQTFLFLRRIGRDMIKNAYWHSLKVAAILVRILIKLEFPLQIFKKILKPKIS